MKALEEKILQEGKVLPGEVLKVGSFLNQQIDTDLLTAMGQEGARLFKDAGVTKVLTIEASGIALAVMVGAALHVPAVFAKKSKTINVSGDVYTTVIHSYTHGKDNDVIVPKDYLSETDNVLIVDDFLATGTAVEGLIDLVGQAGAKVAGVISAVEKGFQGGGDALRARGIRVESLAVVESMSDTGLTFRAQ